LLSSDGLVDSDKNVTYLSENKIELQAGFEFSSDGTGSFAATNADCPENNLLTTGEFLSHFGFLEGGTDDYLYDANGNLTYDDDKKVALLYNFLNLPYEATKETDKVEWIYTASGEKLQKIVIMDGQNPKSKEYYGQIETADASSVVFHSEGQVRETDTGLQWEYNIKDHLGNNKLVYTDSDFDGELEIIQNNYYYPFGMEMSGEWDNRNSSDNKYFYNGKELQMELGLGLYDYGARFYNPAIGRFGGVDNFAFAYHNSSPYSYVQNNPVLAIDVGGNYIVIPRNKYRSQVLNDLAKIYMTPEGRKIIDQLMNSDEAYTIKAGRFWRNDASEYNGYFARTIDYEIEPLKVDKMTSYSYATLAHELKHAYNHDLYGKEYASWSTERQERSSVSFANTIREYYGDPKRYFYNGKRYFPGPTRDEIFSRSAKIDKNAVKATGTFYDTDHWLDRDGKTEVLETLHIKYYNKKGDSKPSKKCIHCKPASDRPAKKDNR